MKQENENLIQHQKDLNLQIEKLEKLLEEKNQSDQINEPKDNDYPPSSENDSMNYISTLNGKKIFKGKKYVKPKLPREYILDYLKNGSVNLPKDTLSLMKLNAESQYYKLTELGQMIEEKLQHLTKN